MSGPRAGAWSRRLGSWLVVLLAVAGAACAAGGTGEDGPTTTASEDQRRSDQLLLSQFDLPDGFEDELDEFRTAELHDRREECLRKRGAKPTDAVAGGEAVDASTDSALIGSASNIFATEELAHRRVDLLRSAEFRTCSARSLEEAFDKEVKRRRKEVPGFRIELAELPFAAIADEVVAYRTTISAGVRGRDLFLDTVHLRVQRVVGSYIFLGFGRTVPAGVQEKALRSAASRIVSLHVYSTPTLAPGTPPTTGEIVDTRLNGVTLAKADFPLGWLETKSAPLVVDAEAAFRRCLGLRNHLDRPWVNSPGFLYGNAASAGSIAVLARSEDESARWLAAVQGPVSSSAFKSASTTSSP